MKHAGMCGSGRTHKDKVAMRPVAPVSIGAADSHLARENRLV